MTQKRDPLIVNSAADSLLTVGKQIFSTHDENVVIASADAGIAYAIGYPFAYNKSVAKHGPWMAPDATVLVVGLVSAASGTFTITVNDKTTATIVYNPTAAVVAAELLAIGYKATVDLVSSVYTITFDDTPEVETVPTVTGDVGSITGGTPTAVPTAGTSTNGTQKIAGFVNPNVIQNGKTTGTVTLTVLDGSDTVCTAVSLVPHNLVDGMQTTVSGATEAKLNILSTDLAIVDAYTYTYTVAAVAGGTVDAGTFVSVNDTMGSIMTQGKIHTAVPEALVAAGDVTALRAALKDGLNGQGIIVQGLAGVH